ncbi:aspartate--ammonia ligase [Candidatus Micrarchaeota archaeon]|nr:aspartate--ammonia ligase [Candidatus Micrarchaeota archaeon]
MKLYIPPGYKPLLRARDTEAAIQRIKSLFQKRLSENLNLYRASAPMVVRAGTGINDDLNGVERKVSFSVKDDNDAKVEIVNSLAKWKRMALARYGYSHGEGIWTDMNAIRPDEELDNTHSVYVDQWDWERVINTQERNPDFLKWAVKKIYDAIKRIEWRISQDYGARSFLPEEISFITTSELEGRYPDPDRKARENAVAEHKKAVFIMQIGWPLKDGKPHDGRAPDYDDWNLNGDIFVWNPVLKSAFELSSMGIRVDKETLVKQLQAANAMERLELEFHKMLMADQLPLSIGGGIGQSRLSMLYLGAAHIGEVQVGIWPAEMVAELERNNIKLL